MRLSILLFLEVRMGWGSTRSGWSENERAMGLAEQEEEWVQWLSRHSTGTAEKEGQPVH